MQTLNSLNVLVYVLPLQDSYVDLSSCVVFIQSLLPKRLIQ